MKGGILELQIKETYKEEKLIVQAPQETKKVQKVIEFAENLDQKKTIKGKIDDQVYLVKIGKIQRFYIENRKVLAETSVRPTALIYDSIKFLKFYRPLLSKFPNLKSSISTPSLISSSRPTVWLKFS